MLKFQPPGFGQRAIATSLGVMAYYTPVGFPWRWPDDPEEKPPLIFLHSLGGGSSAYEWSKVYSAFASDYQVIAPDLVGWGQSAHPERDYCVEDYLTLLAELIEAVGEPPATVFASSLTAGLVIRLAIQRPELFHLLVLVCPSGYGDFGSGYAQGIPAQLAGVPGLNQAIYTLGAANEVAIRSFMERFLFYKPERITPEMVAAYLSSATQRNAEYAALSSLRGDLCFDLSLYMPQLKTKTVIAWGDRAWFTRVDTGKRLAFLNPKVVQAFAIIAEAGVLPHLETPEQVIRLAKRVLSLSPTIARQ